ncbi:hypothetical protein WA026_003144 [Henosepilachna vigintioctopunctata]|uniref:Uncharacterized protein n=1 Tax=Henosepilachna vigintioctopunctata TaxID=420089 RepID=A0AAW1TN57_9CUCU
MVHSSFSQRSQSSLRSTRSFSQKKEIDREWKHVCPCDSSRPQELVSVSNQCLCEELSLKKEFTLYFFNTIMEKLFIKESNIFNDEYETTFQSSEEIKHIQKDIRKLSQDDMRKSLYGAGGNQLIMKKPKRLEIKDNKFARRMSKSRKSLQPITEDGSVELEKITAISDSDYNWIVKRDEDFARLTFKNGNVYEGDVVDKVPHGKGTFWWADGTVYEGQFEDGAPTGKGKMLLPDLTEYTGDFYKGYFHGNGVYNIRSTNMVYTGGWKYGKKHGSGWLLFEPGVWYEGEFIDDLRHGKGFFQYKDGGCYEGSYVQNKREGHGAMRWTNNDIYIGEWSDGMFHGCGEYAWKTVYNNAFAFPVQHYYKGSWVNGKRTGKGMMFFGSENGAKMAGIFQDNFKHGPAVVICGNGRSVEENPLFYNDKPIHKPPSADTEQNSSSETCNRIPSNANINIQSNNKAELTTNQDPTLDFPVYPVVEFLDLPNKRKEILCNPTEIQINSSPDDIELYFYIEKALELYINAFDTIQFDMESSGSSVSSFDSKFQLSKWNLMTLNSNIPPKANKSFLQDVMHGRSSVSQCTTNIKSHSRFQSTIKNEEKYLRNVIVRYLPKLTEVYYHYACITSPTKIYFRHFMIRMFLWQLYIDIGMTERGISLVEIDKLLSENPASYVESSHNPFEHIYFFQFIQSLLGTAFLMHQKIREMVEELRSSDGLTPYIFENFLLKYVFVHAGSHKGRCLFEFKDVLPMKNVYSLYLKLGEPLTARAFLNTLCTRKHEEPPCYKAWSGNSESLKHIKMGHNVNAVGHNFLFIPEEEEIGKVPEEPITDFAEEDPFFQDLSKFRVLGPKVVVECLCSVCPPIKHDGIICNINYPMTFLEFYEVLICCTLLTIARFKKKKELLKKFPVDNLKSDDDFDIESGSRKESIKLKKKKTLPV